MERWGERWRTNTRMQWLGWTVLYGLIYFASGQVSSWLPSDAGAIVNFSVWVVAAFLIGTQFRSRWWLLGPAAVLLTFFAALILRSVLGPQIPTQTSFGMATPRESLANPYALLVLVLGLPLVSAILAFAASAGVWWGQRRQQAAAFRDDNRLKGGRDE